MTGGESGARGVVRGLAPLSFHSWSGGRVICVRWGDPGRVMRFTLGLGTWLAMTRPWRGMGVWGPSLGHEGCRVQDRHGRRLKMVGGRASRTFSLDY